MNSQNPAPAARSSLLGMADASFAFQMQLRQRLREIDRKALNAQLLVKRHGRGLAGYGVVAQSFRDGAQQLQHAAARVREAIQPLIVAFMQSLRDGAQFDKLRRLPEAVHRRLPQLEAMQRERGASHDAQRRRACGEPCRCWRGWWANSSTSRSTPASRRRCMARCRRNWRRFPRTCAGPSSSCASSSGATWSTCAAC